MKIKIKKKLLKESKTIDISQGDGSMAFGVVHNNPESIKRWLTKNGINQEIDLPLPIAFLNNINVEEEDRGQGVGTEMLYDFEDQASGYGAKSILLLARLDEDQLEGFNLEKWYLDNDYEVLTRDGDGNPLMYKKLEDA